MGYPGNVLLGTILFWLTASVFYTAIHSSVHVVFRSQKVRRSLDEVTEGIKRSTADVYFKIILQYEQQSTQVWNVTTFLFISFVLFPITVLVHIYERSNSKSFSIQRLAQVLVFIRFRKATWVPTATVNWLRCQNLQFILNTDFKRLEDWLGLVFSYLFILNVNFSSKSHYSSF